MIDLTTGCVDFFSILSTDNYSIADLESMTSEERINQYEQLLALALLKRAEMRDNTISRQDQSKIFPYIKHILEWLRKSDFYTAPASVKYHDNVCGGLLMHTLKAYNQLVSLRGVTKFKEVSDNQWWNAVFVILVHDWCKIGRYESYYKNVKNTNTGVWEQILSYKYKEDSIGRLGHGTQSLIMAMQLCNNKYTSLTFEEMAAIRWHMDNWDMSTYDADDLSRCNEKIPMVRMVQFADQLAITTY